MHMELLRKFSLSAVLVSFLSSPLDVPHLKSPAGSFLPVTLEQLARERGVLWSDKTTSCMAKAASDAGTATVARLLTRAAGADNDQCVIPTLGNITTTSFALYTFSLAVFVQALALVSFSSVADHGESSLT